MQFDWEWDHKYMRVKLAMFGDSETNILFPLFQTKINLIKRKHCFLCNKKQNNTRLRFKSSIIDIGSTQGWYKGNQIVTLNDLWLTSPDMLCRFVAPLSLFQMITFFFLVV